ncbi:MAG: PEP-CTERM sorting domain-containing protein [Cyanobacteriota bacterium]|nr:PEP-CTERM sorting domain-containing protein [Cyanobacteriota bacterium]
MKTTKVLTSTFVLGSLLLGGLAPAEAAKLVRTWDVGAAVSDGVYNMAGHDHVTWLPHLPGGDSYFIADGDITFNEYNDGTANLFGSVVGKNNASEKWDFDVWFEGASPQAGTGGPKKELKSSAYAPNGPVDTDSWYYYDFHSTKSSVFTGVAGSFYDGKTISIDDVTGGESLVQVGEGANGKNTNMGLSTWFNYDGDYKTSGNQHGDFNIDLVEVPEPAAMSFMGLALLGLGASQLKRKNNN